MPSDGQAVGTLVTGNSLVDDLPPAEVNRVVAQALAEDLPWGDLTSDHLIPADQLGVGRIEGRQPGVLAGLAVAKAVFLQLDPALTFAGHVSDGEPVHAGQSIATVAGSLRSLLQGERVALNFLQRLSGIATSTNHY